MAFIDTEYLRGSDGTGPAVLAHVQTPRLVGSTVLDVDLVTKWNGKCIVTTGTLLPSGFINPTTVTEFKGRVVAGDIIIDSFEPGFSDVGNTAGQVAIVKQTTGWANGVVDELQALKAEDVTRFTASEFDFIKSGGVWTGLGYGANLNASMTAIVAYINGYRQTVAAIATRTFTANKDTYIDILYNASGVATLVYTEVANNTASPALAANSIRLAIVVSGATNILNVGSINQGQENKILPVFGGAFGIAVTDSLGNLICPRDPNRKLLGLRSVYSSQAGIGTGGVDLNGMFAPVIVPEGRKVKITAIPAQYLGSGVNVRANIIIMEGATTLKAFYADAWGGSQGIATPVEFVHTPATPGLHTYKLFLSSTTGTILFYADASSIPQFRVELE